MKDYSGGNGLPLRKTLRKIFLLLSLFAFGVSLFSLFQYWDYEESLVDISKQLQLKVTNKNITDEIDAAIKNSQFDDAKMFLDIAESNQYAIDYKKYHNVISRNDTGLRKIVTEVSNFADGFIEGKSSNMTGIAGSVSADFTVVGDVRDLYKQYGKYEKGEDVNELIVVLSGAGIGLTALTVGTLGSAAPAKAGTSLIKVAAKTQRITLRFQKLLLKHGRKVFDWPAFTRLAKQNKSLTNLRRAAKQAYHPEAIKPLKTIAGRVNNIRKSSSTVDAIHMLKYVETTDDLRHLEKITVKYGSKSKGYLKLLGKGVLRTVRVLRKTTELMLSILSSFFSGLSSLFFFALRKF